MERLPACVGYYVVVLCELTLSPVRDDCALASSVHMLNLLIQLLCLPPTWKTVQLQLPHGFFASGTDTDITGHHLTEPPGLLLPGLYLRVDEHNQICQSVLSSKAQRPLTDP